MLLTQSQKRLFAFAFLISDTEAPSLFDFGTYDFLNLEPPDGATDLPPNNYPTRVLRKHEFFSGAKMLAPSKILILTRFYSSDTDAY